MSEEKSQKIYADGMFCDKKPNNYGGHFIKVGINTDKFIEFLKLHKNERGYVNLCIFQTKEGKPYCTLDTFVPQQQNNDEQSQQSEPESDLPF